GDRRGAGVAAAGRAARRHGRRRAAVGGRRRPGHGESGWRMAAGGYIAPYGRPGRSRVGPPTHLPPEGATAMADETNPTPPATTPQVAGQPTFVQVQVDVSKMETIYANFVRLSLSSSTEEVVMDMG